eukprot:2156040-Pleurochrysis_carterae.AAC.1
MHSSMYFGFSARTGAVGPPRFQTHAEVVVLLWYLKFGLVYKTFDAHYFSEMLNHSPPSTADVATNLGESSKARARRLPSMHTRAISEVQRAF